MKTEIIRNKKGRALAANHIKMGQLVAFGTETVYGLGANALNHDACKKIFEVKGRPQDNPLIVHLASIKDINKVGIVDDLAQKAIKAFMPGAITIVVKKNHQIPNIVTAGLDTVAIRIPKSKAARRFIAICGVPIAAPSANTSTKPSPTSAQDVYEDLNGKIKYILDTGKCKIGVESTIIDFSTGKIRILRSGGISDEKLIKVFGKIESSKLCKDKPIAPGLKYRHYAPNAKIVLFNFDDLTALTKRYQTEKANGKNLRVFCFNNKNLDKISKNDAVVFKSQKNYAKRLFFELRKSDRLNADLILAQLSLNSGLGKTINNRLTKAAGEDDE